MPTEIEGDYSGFPVEIREHFRTLQGAVCELRQSREVYHRLFISDKQRTELLSDQLGPLLGVFQNLLQEELFLSISRLTDKDSNMAQDNLSLRALLSGANIPNNPGFDAKAESALSEIEASATKIRKHRHKRIAHSDLPTSLNAAKLPEVTFAEIRDIGKNMEAFLNLFDFEFRKTTMRYEFLPGSDITAKAENTCYKSKTYDLLEAEGTIPHGEWIQRFRAELSKRH